MAASYLSKLSFLVTSLLSISNFWAGEKSGGGVGVFPPTCNRIECPTYDVIQTGNGFEIRRYNSSVWISVDPVDDISFVGATRTGFLQLFNYIQGNNDKNQTVEMTAPVITEVKPSDGPICASSFVTSFYVPKENQESPPLAKGLHLLKWGATYVAVRQFSGFVEDDEVGEEAAALYNSIAGTVWGNAVDKSQGGESDTNYIVAQYNSPFEFRNRVNEIWLKFDVEDAIAIEIERISRI